MLTSLAATADSPMPSNRSRLRCNNRILLLVFIFYFSIFWLLSSGRLASGDAGTQLQAAMLLITTGQLGTSAPPNKDGLWVEGIDGKYYQCHDIGNALMMSPGAWLGATLSKAPPETKFLTPPLLARVSVALTCASLSALALLYLFRFFDLFYSRNAAFFLSFAFVTTTFFGAYTKSAWDVLGAGCFVCPLLFYSAQILSGERPMRNVLLASLSLLLAGLFRYSLIPFLGLALAGVLFFSRRHLRREHWIASGLGLVIGMIPTFLYNYVRMGSPFRPATTAPAFIAAGTADLSGNLFVGLYVLLISPNRGLLVFAPIFLLLFGLPLVWKRLPLAIRHLALCFGVGALLHILMLARLRFWGLGWGPRYLVTVLPILFFLATVVLMALWEKHKGSLMALIGLSMLLSFPAMLVNWHLAITEYPNTMVVLTPVPYQQMAIWRGLALGLQGKPLPAPREILDDPVRSGGARFPDLWTVRLMERSRKGFLLGGVIMLFLLASALWSLKMVLQEPARNRAETE